MPIRKPSAKLAAPNITTLKTDEIIHRVHDRRFRANAFNPCKGGDTRFAPINDSNDQCIESLYAGSTLDSAIYETIFHDVPVKAKLKTVLKVNITSRAHGALQVCRDIKLATLHGPDLRKWRCSRNNLIASPTKDYCRTAAWAKAIHDQFPVVAGLLWTSNQCDPDIAYLFFGDRVSSADFEIITARDGLTDNTFMTDVRAAGGRGDIRITV